MKQIITFLVTIGFIEWFSYFSLYIINWSVFFYAVIVNVWILFELKKIGFFKSLNA